jgi:3-oxoacyl-[acyl-carrier protein] reductase
VDMGLAGKVAVVAGGARGCGRGVSEALAAEGANVVLVGRVPDIVAATAAAINDKGGSARGVVADMTTEEGVDTILSEARRLFGDPDILVVNAPNPQRRAPTAEEAAAGVHHGRGFDHCDDADYLATFEFQVLSQVRLARAVLPAMVERHWGRLVNIATIAFKTPHQEDPLPATDAGRMGVAPLMKIISYEYGKYGITANTIATGPFASELAAQYQATNPEIKTPEWYLKMLPVGRWAIPSRWAGSRPSSARSAPPSSPAR